MTEAEARQAFNELGETLGVPAAHLVPGTLTTGQHELLIQGIVAQLPRCRNPVLAQRRKGHRQLRIDVVSRPQTTLVVRDVVTAMPAPWSTSSKRRHAGLSTRTPGARVETRPALRCARGERGRGAGESGETLSGPCN
jgi:hypothetical protein